MTDTANQNLIPKEEYEFSTTKERVVSRVVGVATVAAVGAGLCAVFNPVAVGIAGGYAVFKLGKAYAGAYEPLWDKSMKKSIARGSVSVLDESPEHDYFLQSVKTISKKYGFEKPPKIYLLSDKIVARMLLWPGFRGLFKLVREKVMPKVFGALPGLNTIIATKEALAKEYAPEQLDFIVAHELGHMKTDAFNASTVTKVLSTTTIRALGILSAGAAIAGSAGMALPVAISGMSLVSALGALAGFSLAAKLGVGYVSRMQERRADRNALYVTGNLDAALSTMDTLHGEAEPAKKTGLAAAALSLSQAFATHPDHRGRKVALCESFAQVSKYQQQNVANDNEGVAPQMRDFGIK